MCCFLEIGTFFKTMKAIIIISLFYCVLQNRIYSKLSSASTIKAFYYGKTDWTSPLARMNRSFVERPTRCSCQQPADTLLLPTGSGDVGKQSWPKRSLSRGGANSTITSPKHTAVITGFGFGDKCLLSKPQWYAMMLGLCIYVCVCFLLCSNAKAF